MEANSGASAKKSPLSCFLGQAGVGTAFTYLTSGVFLSGLALFMGAGDVLVSYLSIVLNLCGVLVLFFSGVLERVQSRKRLTIALTVLSRLATLSMVLIPALAPREAWLWLFVPVVVIAFTLQAQTTVALNQWMLLFLEGEQRGRYISRRQTVVLVVTVTLSLLGGWFMDYMEGAYLGFLLLFGAAALMGALEVILLLRTPDGAAYQGEGGGCSLGELMRLPLRDKPFARYVLYVFFFYLLLYVGDSYTMVYLMRYLALPYQTVNLLYMIISVPQLLLLRLWGRVSDRRGARFVLSASIWLFLGETGFLFLGAPEHWYLFVPLAFLISSAANSGFVISVFNRRYELMPQERRIAYDNFYTAAVGLAFILGPMLGGALKTAVESNDGLMSAMPFANIRLLYLASTVGVLVLQGIYAYSERRNTHVKH